MKKTIFLTLILTLLLAACGGSAETAPSADNSADNAEAACETATRIATIHYQPWQLARSSWKIQTRLSHLTRLQTCFRYGKYSTPSAAVTALRLKRLPPSQSKFRRR